MNKHRVAIRPSKPKLLQFLGLSSWRPDYTSRDAYLSRFEKKFETWEVVKL